MKKVWVYKRTGIKGWWIGWYESGKSKAKALPNASVGGSPVEARLSEDALKAFPTHLKMAIQFKDNVYVDRIEKENQETQEAWYTRLRQLDKGLVNGEMPWLDIDYDASEWPEMNVPGYWADGYLGLVNGVVWFHKEFDVPSGIAGQLLLYII